MPLPHTVTATTTPSTCGGRLVAREALGQLEVAVDRVADEVDGDEGAARHALRIGARQGTQMRSSAV